MTEQGLTVFAEVFQRLNEMLNKPAIAVGSDVCDALKKIIGSNVVSDAASRFFSISGQEIVNWYGVAAARLTSGNRVAQALEPHFRRVYGVELIDELIPAVEGKIKQTLADLLDWVKKHPIETALLVAVGTDMAITLLNQYSPPRSEEEANIRSAVQGAARYIAAGLSAGLQVRDATLFFLALQTGTKTIALETGVGILIASALNLLILTLTGQWGKEFLIGKTCESVCGRSACFAKYGVYAVPRLHEHERLGLLGRLEWCSVQHLFVERALPQLGVHAQPAATDGVQAGEAFYTAPPCQVCGCCWEARVG